MRSNVSCWIWRLGGLSVTPRTGVRVDLQPDGFAFPHSLACFLIDTDTQVHPKSSKKSGFQGNPLYFCMTGDMKMESDEERGDLKYLPWLVSKPSTISEERTPCIVCFFFFFFFNIQQFHLGTKGPHIPTAEDKNRSGITDLWPHKQIILFPDTSFLLQLPPQRKIMKPVVLSFI